MKDWKKNILRNKTFSAEYDFSCVQQIARTDRFARAIARVKRKGLELLYCIFIKFDDSITRPHD